MKSPFGSTEDSIKFGSAFILVIILYAFYHIYNKKNGTYYSLLDAAYLIKKEKKSNSNPNPKPNLKNQVTPRKKHLSIPIHSEFK